MDKCQRIKERSEEIGERADCGVRSLAAAIGDDDIAYDLAHDCMAEVGRKKGCGLYEEEIVKGFELAGFTLKEISGDYPSARTIRTAQRHLPREGTFLISVRRHVATFKDGTLYDWADGRLHRIQFIYRIT